MQDEPLCEKSSTPDPMIRAADKGQCEEDRDWWGWMEMDEDWWEWTKIGGDGRSLLGTDEACWGWMKIAGDVNAG
ncbi:hypothetical protein E6O75_ATG10481 [Venturia nashicola]|uniref:Uncharacterized protein n=1 Tax=Venturia nashicola TaxID=86259 RepID=A0A4Z1NP75_9PEZI|nr:hypothetical protein E6O75_ATG10481 [Venturia nashicola]